MRRLTQRLSFLLFILATTKSFAVDVGFTEGGAPYLGDLDAPVVLIEYSDYLCPFCARYHSTTKRELVEKYVNTGKMRMEFRHFPLAALHPTAWKGHEAAACAGEQGVEQFWAYHDSLFERQKDWNRLPDPDDFLAEIASQHELERERWQDCVENRSTQKQVDGDVNVGKSLEFTGTPTFQMIASAKPENAHTIVGAQRVEAFSVYADALLAGEEPPKPPEEPKPVLPDWAKTEALAVDPDRSSFTVSGDPTYGNPDARLVIVEYTDYQCPSCARHATESQPTIDEKLVDTGKVRWVSKQLPLPQHANAIVAAAAALCAGNQDHFHEMHKALFVNQKNWSGLDDPDEALIAQATKFDLDTALFTSCLDSRATVERLVNGVYEATSVTRVTPVFVVLDGETGRPIRGARNPDQFVEVVEKHLAQVLKGDAEKAKRAAEN